MKHDSKNWMLLILESQGHSGLLGVFRYASAASLFRSARALSLRAVPHSPQVQIQSRCFRYNGYSAKKSAFPFRAPAPSNVRYDDADETGRSAAQRRFDALVVTSVLKYFSPHRECMKVWELFDCLKKADPTFRPENFGVEHFGILVHNCVYLNGFGALLHFTRVRDSQSRPVGLEPYTFREAKPVDGVRQGPDYQRFSGTMLPQFQQRRKRK